MTAPDVNNPTAEATELASVGKTEGEIELANGEQVGDRLGDTPVEGVAQTRNGIGELLTEAQAPAINTLPVDIGVIVLKPAIDGQPLAISHVALHPPTLDRIHHLIDVIEGDAHQAYTYVVEELRRLIPHHRDA